MTSKHRSVSLLAAAAALTFTAMPLLAQKPAAKHETQSELQAQAKVPMETARTAALAQVKNGTVKSEELEREHGRLVYSFDISTPRQSGVNEVNVDARTGKLVGRVMHESAAKERAEMRAEARESTTTSASSATKPGMKHEMKPGLKHEMKHSTAPATHPRSAKKDSTYPPKP